MPLTTNRSVVRLFTAVVVAVGLVVSTLLVSSPAEANRVKPNFFGMHDGRVGSGSLPTVRIGSIRLWDSGVTWRQIETSPGHFEWDSLDRAVDTARAQGVRPMIVLGQTPRFHARHRNAKSFYGRGASSMPKMRPWKRYVGKVAGRYKNTVDYQIWNEPNVVGFWTGSVGQMATLTATASKQITKKAGRRATVVAPSFPLRLRGQQRWYREYWHAKVHRKSVARYVDVVAANPYPMGGQTPEASVKLIRYANRALPRAARRKPMWNTEINYGLGTNGTNARQISGAKQAAYVARTMVLNAASSIKRMYWYSWTIGDIANTHLAESDGTTLTRAGRAWEEARSWINRTNVQNCKQARRGKMRGVYTCTAKVSRREVRRIYWKPSGRRARVHFPRSVDSTTTLSGRTTDRGGRFTMRIGQSPVMVATRR